MKFNFKQFQKKIFCVCWAPDRLSLVFWGNSGTSRFETLFLQEASREGMASQVSLFLKGQKNYETLLILPRSEVLQKEILFEGPQKSRESLETKLSQILPYSPREMAYGLLLESEEKNRGLLYAITEKKIQGILEFTASLGICTDEVTTEDQTLCWAYFEESLQHPVLLVDQTPERVLFAVIYRKRICISRTIAKENEDLNGMLAEAALCLLELNQKPEKVVYSGVWNEDEIRELHRQFQIPVEKLDSIFLNGNRIPASLSGSRFFGQYAFTSLLPAALKVTRWHRKQAFLFRTLAAAAGLFFLAMLLAGFCHLSFLKMKTTERVKEAQSRSMGIKEIKEMAVSLAKTEQADSSKRRALELMRDLAERMPPAIRLHELQVEGKDIVFRGESPSHSLLTEAVQVFEKEKNLHEINLEHTRLRRRLNQDYFEFEVSGKWRN